MPSFLLHLALLAVSLSVTLAPASAQLSPEAITHAKAGIEARQAKRYDDARRELEAAVRLAPDVAEVHLNLGLVYHEQGELSLAVETLQRALALKPDVKGARSLIGFDLLTLGRYGPAVEILEKAYEEEPTAQVSSWLGLAYLKSGRPREAIPRLETALSEQGGQTDLLYYLAKAYSMVAAQVQLTLLQGAPDSARAHQTMGDDHALNGRTDEAIAEYERALEQDSGATGIHSALGDLYREASQYEEAARHYEQELRLTPDDLEVRHRYGSVLLQLGRSSDALPHLRAAAEEDPPRAEALFTLGKALLDQDDLSGAMQAFRAVLDAQPTLQQAMSSHYQIAQILRQQGNPEAASEHLNEFNRLRGQLIRAEQQ